MRHACSATIRVHGRTPASGVVGCCSEDQLIGTALLRKGVGLDLFGLCNVQGTQRCIPYGLHTISFILRTRQGYVDGFMGTITLEGDKD